MRILADYGASVWMVDRVASSDPGAWEVPFYAYGGGRWWRRAELDLRDPDGRDAFLVACGRADVVIDGFRPGVADRLGVGAGAAREHNPGLIWCSASGFGADGPYASWAGHDINFCGLSGFTALSQRRADGAPPLTGASIADAAGGGMHAAIAVLAALVDRGRTGSGAVLDCSATEGMVAIMALAIDEHLAAGDEPGHPGGGLLSGEFACYDHYEASDGGWIALGAIEPRFFRNLCEATGLDHLVADQYEPAAQPVIRAELAALFLRSTRDEWVATLGPLDTCVTPVLDPGEVVSDAHLAHRSVTMVVDHEIHGRHRQVGPVLGGTRVAEGPLAVPDRSRSETGELLQACGMDPAAVDRLATRGVIG